MARCPSCRCHRKRYDEVTAKHRKAALNLLLRGVLSLAAVAAIFQTSPTSLRRWQQLDAAGAPLWSSVSPGRPSKLSAASKRELRVIGASAATGSASMAAAAFKKATGITIGRSSAHRILSSDGHAFRVFRRVPLLSPAHMLARVAFSKTWLRVDLTKVMWTDSKYFTVHSSCGRYGHYTLTSNPPSVVPCPKRGASLHVYMGVTWFGLTRFVVVTGGSVKNTTRTIPNGKNKGRLYKGVCAQEYQEKVLPMFKEEGGRLFGSRNRRSWMLQQDGARIHQTDASLAMAAAAAPGGLVHPWPPNSPDLSIIENVWSLMARKLALRPPCTKAAELEVALNEIRDSFTPEELRGLFDSIPRRLQDCIDSGGATTRF